MEQNLFKFGHVYQRDNILFYEDVELLCDIGEFSTGDGFVAATLDLTTGRFEVFDEGYLFAAYLSFCVNAQAKVDQPVVVKFNPISKEEAASLVEPLIFNVDQFKAVTHENCIKVLGDARFAMLLSDSLRNTGPINGTIYPWHLIDWLINEDPRPNKSK